MMNIEFKGSRMYSEIIVTDDNVRIEEVVSESVIIETNDFKTSDITTESLDKFSELLDEMLYYREREYFNESLTKELFNKMPQEKAIELIKELADEYDAFEE
jgi:hypothetical protein